MSRTLTAFQLVASAFGRGNEAGAAPARIFPALDFLAALCVHVPDSGQQLVRYYGAFSNARRVSAEAPASAPAHPADPQARRRDDSEFARVRRRSWARLPSTSSGKMWSGKRPRSTSTRNVTSKSRCTPKKSKNT